MEKSVMTIFHINWLETRFQQPNIYIQGASANSLLQWRGLRFEPLMKGGNVFLGPQKKQHVWGVRIS